MEHQSRPSEDINTDIHTVLTDAQLHTLQWPIDYVNSLLLRIRAVLIDPPCPSTQLNLTNTRTLFASTGYMSRARPRHPAVGDWNDAINKRFFASTPVYDYNHAVDDIPSPSSPIARSVMVSGEDVSRRASRPSMLSDTGGINSYIDEM